MIWKIIHHKLPILLLCFIFIIGLFLRTYRTNDLLWNQGYDEGRDILIAEHIVTHNEIITRGPLAAGSQGMLKNSPFYFYFISMLWFITRSPWSITIVWAILLSSQIVLGFFIGKKIWDDKLGILISLVFTLHYTLVLNCHELSQPYILPLFSTLFFLSLCFPPSILSLSLSYIFLLLPIQFHYGALLILPIGLTWTTFYWITLPKKTYNSQYKNNIPIFIIIIFFYCWILLTYTKTPFDQFYFFSANFSQNSSFIQQLSNAAMQLFQLISQNTSIPFIVSILILVMLPLTLYRDVLLWKRIKMKYFLAMTLVMSLIFAGFFNGSFVDSYLSSLLPFVLILIALGMRTILHKNQFIGILLILFVIFFISRDTKNYLTQPVSMPNNYNQIQRLSDVIYEDYLSLHIKTDKTPSIGLALLNTSKTMPFDGWGTSGFWYFLEKKTKQPLIYLTNTGVNHQPRETNPQVIYLICHHKYEKEAVLRECLERFKNVRNYLLLEKNIFSSDDFSVWRFMTHFQTKNLWYYHVYQDL